MTVPGTVPTLAGTLKGPVKLSCWPAMDGFAIVVPPKVAVVETYETVPGVEGSMSTMLSSATAVVALFVNLTL